jgi:hypothetical protein
MFFIVLTGWSEGNRMVRCNECGRENRPGARFCDGCGARMPYEEFHMDPYAAEKGFRPSGMYQRVKQFRFLFNTVTVNHDDPSRFVVISNRFMVRQRKVYSKGLWIGVNLFALLPLLFIVLMFVNVAGSIGFWWPILFALVPFGLYLSFFIWTMIPGTSTMVTDEYDDL